MRRLVLALFLTLWAVSTLTGCEGAEKSEVPAEPDPVVEPEPIPQPEPEPYVPAGTNPLTGEPIEPEYESLRPVAVMLNNLKAAQPQLGISQADIIYEVTAEGGITRMVGIYQTLEGVELLGSIRSTRPYYIELALSHDALLVHAGGSQEAYADIRSWGVENMDGVRGTDDAEIFWRDADRRRNNGYEHSLVTSGESIQTYIDGHFSAAHQSGYQNPQTFAEDGTPAGGETAEHVSLRFSGYKTALFDYDAAGGRYLVSQYGKAHIDAATGEQVAAVNLLVLETNISVLDSEGRQRVRTTGEGSGTFFCGGKAVPIRWSREDRNQPFVYTLEDGSPLVLGQGKSYVCIISPRVSTLSFQ